LGDELLALKKASLPLIFGEDNGWEFGISAGMGRLGDEAEPTDFAVCARFGVAELPSCGDFGCVFLGAL
jgi:hypothetical protein